MKNNTLFNTVSNLFARIWSVFANLIFIPLYIIYLGEEAYGLVTFFATLQTVLNILGLGLSKTLRREFAAEEGGEFNKVYKYKLLRTVELVYVFLGFVIILVCWIGSEFISTKYLNIETLSVDIVKITILLMGISIAMQLIANLYVGCLFGLEKQVQANLIQIIWSLIKNGGVIFVLEFAEKDVRVFYTWFIFCDFLYLIVVRKFIIYYLKSSENKCYWEYKDFFILKKIYKYTLGIMFISVGYAINTQVDKIVISGKFSLTEVGAYNTASNLSYVVSMVAAAAGIASFSRFSRLYSSKDLDESKRFFLVINRRTNLIICTLGSFLSVYSYEILSIWTGNQFLTELVRSAAPLIILGTTLSAIQQIPYEFFLSCGITIFNNILTLVSILYVLTVTPIMITKLGLLGAGISWLVQMFITTIIYLFIFYKKYFNKNILSRFCIDLVLPLLGSLLVAFLFKYFIFCNLGNVITVIYAILLGILMLIFWFIIYERKLFFVFLRKFLRRNI